MKPCGVETVLVVFFGLMTAFFVTYLCFINYAESWKRIGL